MKSSGKMDFNDVFEELKKYPFIEKMFICQKHATKIMKLDHIDILNRSEDMIYPWELETFSELSILADGNNPTKTFKLSGYREFWKMINAIREYMHPHLEQKKGTPEFANDFLMVTGMLQFKVQENILNRLYRYNYFFNFKNSKIDLQNEFSTTFNGLKYDDFIEMAVLIYFFASLKGNTSDIIKFILINRMNVVNVLKINRDEYIKRQQDKNNYNLENTFYGFNYLFPYPFLEFMGGVFLPLPYLIIDAITDSLLTRMTYGKDRLREVIGQEIAQKYIYNIMKESNIYDEVLPEQPYWIGNVKIDSPDIMIRQDNYFCYIDSKLSTPKLSLRQFEKIDIDKTIQQYAENIKQLYNRINELGTLFYPFKIFCKIEKQNVFGLVVVFEESYIAKEKIYLKACNIIGVDYNSTEGKFVRSNIKLIDLHGLELFTFSSCSIFASLIGKRDNPQLWNDYGIFDICFYKDIKPRKPKSLLKFEKRIRKIYMEEISRLSKAGIIKSKEDKIKDRSHNKYYG